jgi:hypothetical protein
LLDLILEHAEIVLAKTVHKLPAIVEDAGVENNQVDIDLDAAPGVARGRTGLLAGRRWRRGVLNGKLGVAGGQGKGK